VSTGWIAAEFEGGRGTFLLKEPESDRRYLPDTLSPRYELGTHGLYVASRA